MSDFKRPLGFQDCWDAPDRARTVKSKSGGFSEIASNRTTEKAGENAGPNRKGQGGHAATISQADKARLARVVKGAPEVMVKVSKPAKHDKHGNPIHVSRATEAVRVAEHLAYVSRNGKLDLENDRGEIFRGRDEVAAVCREWLAAHDEDRRNGMASDRTRITAGIIFSMPAQVNAEAVKDAARALAEQEFKGRHDYVMALHTDTKHPHVHVTLRTVGHDGVRLNLRKADLQHLRDTFAEKLRRRGIEAESTRRHARGATRKGEATPVYKIRKRGGKPLVDAKKACEVQRDLHDNEGRLPQKPWDDALVSRRNRVMVTYDAAARILEQSDDPTDRELAAATKAFAARLTDVTTQRASMAQSMEPKRPEGVGKADELPDRSAASKLASDRREYGKEQDKGPER